MNKIYSLVWRRSLGCLVVVSEIARGASPGTPRAGCVGVIRSALSVPTGFVMSLLGSALLLAGGIGNAYALPVDGQVTAGHGQISQSANTTTITQQSNRLSMNWQSFNVASHQTVNFVQPNASSLAVNHILGNQGSTILGHVNANGQVWLINPNGILFGQSAQVNVGGLVASTLNPSRNGATTTFSGSGSGQVINEGTIHAASGGYVALIGNQVSNQGTIIAQLGTVALAGGSKVSVTFSGSQLVQVVVNKNTLNALAENGQLIAADGGHVIMTAGAKDSLLASAVNNTGVVQAQTVQNHNGTITLLGGMTAGTVNVGGTLDASAPNGEHGGEIETSASHANIAAKATITASAKNGQSGTWLVDPVNLTIDSSAASTIDNTLNSGTSVTEQTTATGASGSGTQSSGAGDINVNSALTWTNANATLTLSAYSGVNVNANVSGAGSVVMDAANGNLTIASGVSIDGGTGVTLGTGASFINNSGANAVASASGRWLVYSQNPAQDTTGGLTPNFIQINAPYQTAPIPTTGNGFLYNQAASLNVTGLSGTVGKTYDGTNAASIANSNVTTSGLIDGDTISSLVGSYGSSNAGTGISVTTPSAASDLNIVDSAGISVYGYQLAGSPITTNVGTIIPATLTAKIVNDPTKVYDGTTTATLTASNYQITGFVTGQSATVNQPNAVSYASASAGSQTVDATFASSNFVAGSGTNLLNYVTPTSATGAGTITQAPVDVTGILATNKTYDGTTSDTLNTSQAGLYGVISTDTGNVTLSTSGASGVFASPNAGNNLAVTASGFSLTGTAAANYQIVDPSGLTANIAPKSVTVTGVTATSKVYDGNAVDPLNTAPAALSGVLSQDASNVTLSDASATGTFSQSNVGNGLAVSSSGFALTGTEAANYTLSQPSGLSANITPAPLTISVTGNPTKTYDGTTTAVVSGSDFAVSGFVSGQGATIPQYASAGYASANAGTQAVTVALTPADFSPNSGTSLSNYSLPTSVTGTGTIDPALIAVVIANNPTKAYDGNTSVPSLPSSDYVLSGFVTGQGAAVTQPTGTYASANAGPETITADVTASNYTANSGTSLSNYVLPAVITGSGTITPAVVTANQVNATITNDPTKPYDGTTAIILPGSDFSFSGFATGQGATINQTIDGNFASPNAGSENVTAPLTQSEFTADAGTNLANYVLPSYGYGTGTITPISLSVSIQGNPTKVYNGTTTAILSSSNYNITGFVGSQGAQINASALTQYASANAGTQGLSATLTPSAYTPTNSGTLMSNYVLPTSATGTGTITPAPLYVTGVTANSKVYDTTNAATLSTGQAALSGVISADSGNVTLVDTNAAGTFATANVGSNIAVTPSGFSVTGSQATNYTLQPLTGLTANITPAPLTVIGVTANSRHYNGTTRATLNDTTATLQGVLGSDAVSLSDASASGTFSTANVGNNLSVATSGFSISGAQAGNYAISQPQGLTADITPTPITATITGDPTKFYDGTTSATLTAADYTLNGFVSGQGASVPQSATAAYGTPDAGTSVPVNSTLMISDFVANSGTNLSNYAMPSTGTGTGTITPVPLTAQIIGDPTKVYNGTTATPTLTASNYQLLGFVGGQSASTDQPTGTYGSANAGSEAILAVLASGDFTAASGTNLNNYVLPAQATGNGTITQAPLTVTGITTTNQVYGANANGITADALTGATLTGTIYSGDSVTLASDTIGTLGSSGNVGTDTVTTAMTLTGTGSSNYSITQPTGLTAVISPALLTASVAANKVYDGTTTADLGGVNTTLTGFVTGQGATVDSGVTGTYAQSNVGNGIAITGSGLTSSDLTASSGTLLSNYILPASDNGSGNITPALLTYVATPSTYQYGTTILTAQSGTVTGFVDGQTEASATTGVLTFTTLANSTDNVGKYAIDGAGLTADYGNYTFAQSSANATALSITPAPLTVTGTTTTPQVYGANPNGITADALTGATLTGTYYNGNIPTLTNDTIGTLGNNGDVGTQSVTTNMTLSGTNANDYSITQPTGLTAVITPAQLSAVSSVNKTYDGTTTADLGGVNTTLTGFVTGQGATVDSGVTGTYAQSNVGNGIAITGSDLTSSDLTASSGTLLSNYIL
ncbi:MAG: YDG domain-containing protein, partial [Acidithiobacillus sp.]